MKRIPIGTLLLIRVCGLLFSLILAFKTEHWFCLPKEVLLLVIGIYQLLLLGMYWPVMKNEAVCILFCGADLLIAQMIVLITGGIHSPFLVCILFPIFTLHHLYGMKGLAGAITATLISLYAALPASSSLLSLFAPTEGLPANGSLVTAGISLLLFYLLPFFFLDQAARTDHRLQSLKEKFNESDLMNSKLLVLYEMTGRFHLKNEITQIMDRLLTLCQDLFPAESTSIFLVRSGEVEIYGETSSEEKEAMYHWVMAQKNTGNPSEERNYFIQEDCLMVPLIRGTRIDGVLYFKGWHRLVITNRDAILFSMIANMVCTYLENMEYVNSLKTRDLSDTSVLLDHLDSGKPVRGILDKRIFEREY